MELTLDGCLAAIEDAGLTTADIDGLSTYPGADGTPAGFSGAGAYDVMDALRLNCGWYGSGLETSGQLGSVDQRVPRRSRPGLANHVLCFRSVCEGSAQGDKGRSGVMPGGGGGRRRLQGVGLHVVEPRRSPRRRPRSGSRCSRSAHFHKYGTTKEQMAWIALNARRNAELNPNAIYREPMSIDDYMNVAHDHDAVLRSSTATCRATARPR